MTELLTAMDARANSTESIADNLDADGQAIASEFNARVAARGVVTIDTQSPNGEPGDDDRQQTPHAKTVDSADTQCDDAAAQPRVVTPPVSSEDIVDPGEVEGERERTQVAADPAGMLEQEEANRSVGDDPSDERAHQLGSEPQLESTLAPGTNESSPEKQGPAKILPTICHLRVRGDPELCLCAEAVALLSDLFSCYRMETVELPHSKANGDKDGVGTASVEAAAEVELLAAAKSWAVQTGVSLRRQ